MVHADKENKSKKTPAGRINNPNDAVSQGRTEAPPQLFGEEEEELVGTEKIKNEAEKKKERKGL